MDWRELDGVRWLEAELPGARAAFSTRLGGVSDGPFESLNLGLLTGDSIQRVTENRRGLAAALERDPQRVVVGYQVHGADIVRHDVPQEETPYLGLGVGPAHADGHVTDVEGLTPVVLVADCLPVALAGPGGVAMLHCGWRGLAAGIVARGAAEVGATAAAVGPGIGRCCFEVGEEVLAEFRPLGDDLARGRMLDLPEVARRLLDQAGVERVEVSGLCTSCNPELFFSHRRDKGETGRQAGAAWLCPT